MRKLTPHPDSRGQSMRLFDESDVASTRPGGSYLLSVSNSRAGTIRGMHFQIDQSIGPKLLTVSSGALIDVAVDIRPQSSTYGVAFTAMLRAGEPSVLRIPIGFAHGYQTLEEHTSLLYWLDEESGAGRQLGYSPLSACLSDFWPIKDDVTISEKDSSSPEFEFDVLKVQGVFPYFS